MKSSIENGIRVGSKTNPIVISLSEYKGHSFVDIRKCYSKGLELPLIPTKKGISLNRRDLSNVMDTLLLERKNIEDWFESKVKQTSEKIELEMRRRNNALDKNAREPHKISQSEEDLRDSRFFYSESNGADDLIIFNKTHSLWQLLKKTDKLVNNSIEIITIILSAYHRTKSRFSGEIELDSDIFFEYFEREWGIILGNYIHIKEENSNV